MGIVSKEVGGILYEAEFSVDDNIITVYGVGAVKSTQVNGMKEESLARILLGHLIREGRAEHAEQK